MKKFVVMAGLILAMVCYFAVPAFACQKATALPIQYKTVTEYGIYVEDAPTAHYFIYCTDGDYWRFDGVPECGLVNHDFVKITLKVNVNDERDYEIENIDKATATEFYRSADYESR